MNFFSKIRFYFKKPKVILVTGKGQEAAARAIYQVLKQHFRVGKDVLIFESELKEPLEFKKVKFWLKKSPLPILVMTHIEGIHPNTRQLSKLMPAQGFLVFNSDEEGLRELKAVSSAQCLTFGFQEKADFYASDIKLNGGVNLKINFKGNIVPVWLDGIFSREHIYTSLAAAVVGASLGLNLVEISQALKNYQSPFEKN